MDTTTMAVTTAAIRANVPLLLWGEPGIGKTSVIQQLGDKIGFPTTTLVGSIYEPADFLGLPVANDDGSVDFAPPAWAKSMTEGDHILLLDELTTAAPAVQKAMLRVVHERVVGEQRLSDGVRIIAAANPPDVAVDGWDLPAPLSNRFAHWDWSNDPEAWIDAFVDGFGPDTLNLDPNAVLAKETEEATAAARAAVIGFIKAQPNQLHRRPQDASSAGRAWPSNRSWTDVASMLALAPDDSIAYAVTKACVGDEAAVNFLAWREQADLPDPAAVLADPDVMDYTDRPDRVFAALAGVKVLALSRGTKKAYLQAMEVISMCAEAGRPDVAAPTLVSMAKRAPAKTGIPKKVADAYSDTLSRAGLWKAPA